MKTELIEKLNVFERDLRRLRKLVQEQPGTQVSRQAPRALAEHIADFWVEELRSPLEHRIKLPAEVIESTSLSMKRLHVLSRPNNAKKSYEDTVRAVLKDFKNKFVLPIQQLSTNINAKPDLSKLVKTLINPEESAYLKEGVDCANAGFNRAAIVLGWCSAIDRVRRKIQLEGFAKFNSTSTSIKNQTSGKRKRWNKEFKIASTAELQTVFDEDLIIVSEGMGLLDGNQADRLIEVDFQYRNHSAHPGDAPIEDPHVVAFFTDVCTIILNNPKFKV
ncbi:MAG TPA: hypothetical protein VN577_03370 [Terriglobales bacterium]|nr:hypothetical protein [Terriglobales bacterium]